MYKDTSIDDNLPTIALFLTGVKLPITGLVGFPHQADGFPNSLRGACYDRNIS